MSAAEDFSNSHTKLKSANFSKRILITGGTGLVGQALGCELARLGYRITLISRAKENASAAPRNAGPEIPFPHDLVVGDLTLGPIPELKNFAFDGVFHLLGEPVSQKRWTSSIKERILNSRVDSSKNLLASLSKPKFLLSASAIGIYGHRGQTELTEESELGHGFLSQVCQKWETAVRQCCQVHPECRLVIARLGIILAAHGGALAKMLPLFKAGLGGPLADGKSWMNWIHLEDVVRSMIFAMETETFSGVYNAVSPTPESNQTLTQNLASTLGRPALLRVPSLALQAVFGEMSSILTESQKVVPAQLMNCGFSYQFPSLKEALENLIGEFKNGETKLVFEQYIPGEPENIFTYFSDEKNLEAITPSSLSFHVVEKSTPSINQGTKITYKLRIHGFPIFWVTSIDTWEPPFQFVDNQIKGPYARWHHTHQFFQTREGVIMRDTIIFKEPLGFLGHILAGPFVRQEVKNIFSFRKVALANELKPPLNPKGPSSDSRF